MLYAVITTYRALMTEQVSPADRTRTLDVNDGNPYKPKGGGAFHVSVGQLAKHVLKRITA